MTRRFVLSYVRTCPHSGKRTYATKRAAKRVAREAARAGLAAKMQPVSTERGNG